MLCFDDVISKLCLASILDAEQKPVKLRAYIFFNKKANQFQKECTILYCDDGIIILKTFNNKQVGWTKKYE